MKILVCDDRGDDALSVAQRIKQASSDYGFDAEVTVFSKKNELKNDEEKAALAKLEASFPTSDLKGAITDLFAREEAAVESNTLGEGAIAFDGFDIAVIDSNLAYLHITGARHTADTVAGPIRSFSTTPYLVSTNGADFDFDLQYLVGDPKTVADFGIPASHLGSQWLWKRTSSKLESFRPWYWPDLLNAPKRRREQIKLIGDNIDNSIVKTLDFPKGVLSSIPRSAVAWLSPDADDPRADESALSKVTFRTFFRNACRSLPRNESEALADSKAAWAKDVIARVVAAELEHWLRRELLGPQEVLVDSPHLISRMPFLLGSVAPTSDRLQASVESSDPPYGIDKGLYAAHLAIDDRQFKNEPWLDRPAFWRPPLMDSGAIAKLALEYNQSSDFVFLEDQSRFEKRNTGESGPWEFVSKFDSAGTLRYVGQLEGVRYAPKSSFSV